MAKRFHRLLPRMATAGAASAAFMSATSCDDTKAEAWTPPRGSLGLAQVATWDADWDCREGSERSNITRHLVLVRHGQYVEGGRQDATMVLTELGRRQAELTGQRLGRYLPDNAQWKAIHQSDMIRAKETAEIIAAQLPSGVPMTAPNPLLNEGYPADVVPSSRAMWKREDTWKDAPRIEAAFRSLFYRAPAAAGAGEGARGDPRLPPPPQDSSQTGHSVGVAGGMAAETPPPPRHEYELVVCHGNVIRYFVCRALQVPPELWLRWAVFNCGITHICISPAGRCSIISVGDVGHLDNAGALTYGHYHGYDMSRKYSRL